MPLSIFLLAFAGSSVLFAQAAPTARPDARSIGATAAGAPGHHNVLVLIADDMGVERTPAYGLDLVPNPPTPTLDLLAQHGVLFRNAYSQPLCSPTRLSILTGLHPFRTGVGVGVAFNGGNGNVEPDPGDYHTLAEALAPTHRSVAVGKWHLSRSGDVGGRGYQHPVDFGFHAHTGVLQNISAQNPAGYFDWTKSVADAAGNTQFEVENTYQTTDQVDDALAAIDAAGDGPWFVWVGFNTPHTPYHVPPAHLRTIQVNPDSSPSVKHQAAIEAMDTEIARLLRSIPAAVLARTWIVFLGDNGSPALSLPGIPVAKGNVNEFGVHVPLIVVGPDVVRPGREVEALVGVTDLYDSLCEMARVPVPDTGLDSVSIMPYLRDPFAVPRRAYVYVETFTPNGPSPYTKHHRALRGSRWKLSRRTPGQPPAIGFHNLLSDPYEAANQFPTSGPVHAAIFNGMAALMEELHD
jgi:arylsulfatase B